MKKVLLMEPDKEKLENSSNYMLRSCDVCGKPYMGYRDVISTMSLYDKAVCAACEAEYITVKSKVLAESKRQF